MHLCKMYSCTLLQNIIVLASDQSRFRYSHEKVWRLSATVP